MNVEAKCSICGKTALVDISDESSITNEISNALCEECRAKKEAELANKRREAYLKTLDGQMSERFVCCKCSSKGAHVDRIATTGGGVSRILDLQCHNFLVASCRKCGYTEMYNLDLIEAGGDSWVILDLLLR